MDPRYRAAYARLYREHWWWRAREDFVRGVLERVVGPGGAGEILDFGCGDGLLFHVLERYGTPHGIETDAAMLDPNGPWRSSIRTDPLELDETETGRYGLVVALDVLEHIQNPAPTLQELRRRLRPGGWLVATVPAFRALWTRHDDLNQHFNRYQTHELEQLVRGAGLDVVESRYFFVWLAVAKWCLRQVERVVNAAPRPPTVPWKPLNRAALALAHAEQAVVGGSAPPFGSSLLVVARAPGAE